MKMLIKSKRKLIIGLLTIITIINLSAVSVAFADDEVKSNLENKLEQQEEQMKDDMGNGIVPKDDKFMDDALNSIQNAKYDGFDLEKKKNSIINFINTFVVKSRTIVIIGYAVLVAILSIYMATIGSRSLSKRRNGMLLIVGNTILFLIFINIPLFIIYFTVAKENMGEGISLYTRIVSILDFFRANSFIISILLAYLGVTKIIVSKNDLPTRQQGRYLIKSAIVLLFVLNLIPIAIRFII